MRRRYECLAIIAASCLLLQGCSNAIVYGEQNSIAIAIKTQPDPQAPITGTIGLRQHIIAVVPPITQESSPPDGAEVAELKALLSAVANGLTEMQTIHQGAHGGGSAAGGQPAKQKVVFVPRKGEAVSLISSFKFVKIPGRIEIRTALITGQAAADLSMTQAKEAMAAVGGGIPEGLHAAARTVINRIHQGLDDMAADNAEAGRHRDAMENAIGSVQDLCVGFTRTEWFPPAGQTSARVQDVEAVTLGSQSTAYREVMAYWGTLGRSVGRLDEWQKTLKNLDNYKYEPLNQQAIPVLKDSPWTTMLEFRRENQRNVMRRLGKAVGSAPAIRAAIEFFVDQSFK